MCRGGPESFWGKTFRWGVRSFNFLPDSLACASVMVMPVFGRAGVLRLALCQTSAVASALHH